ncbi:MAG: hypothetical protein A3J83_04670 [Elusimicrobia bacterium RIFOXYA2_FULL_40_6]|nr:MAG: hypothetical protein A3J83_04670 [Elusimicrobia bacterium RIFOXYA2_FULL_40_6]
MEKAKILVIDDEKGIRDMLLFTLKQEGYEVILADSGTQGIEKIKENDIDLIITDIKMPDIEGTVVLEEAKKIKPDVEVIMATGYVTVETAVDSIKKGAYDYISKPFNIDEMLIIVAKALEHSRLKKTVVKDAEIIERLRELEIIKTEFLSNVVHELRTPLMSIKNSLDLIIEELEGKIDASASPSVKTLFAVSMRNAGRMGNLIKEIMDFSKMESGTFEIKKKKFSLKQVIDDTVSELKPITDNKKLSLTAKISNEIREIDADSDRIKQVIINLIGNAVKFVPEGGQIKVEALPYENDPNGDDGKFVHISVIDTGCGISNENLEKIFQKFYQVKGPQSSAGIGLGLSIAKNIVDAHGGKIWVESEGMTGKGAKFSFTLPKG